jgi:hypothetical protein
MAYLHKVLSAHELSDLSFGKACIALRQQSKPHQFVAIDVVSILLRKQILINPMATTLGQDDGAMHVVIHQVLPKMAGLRAVHLDQSGDNAS